MSNMLSLEKYHSLLVKGFEFFDKEFLKPESREKREFECSINDFIPDKIAEFEKILKEKTWNHIKNQNHKQLENSLKRAYNRSISDLKEEKRIQFEEFIKSNAESNVKKRVKAFKRGELIGNIIMAKTKKLIPFEIEGTDFKDNGRGLQHINFKSQQDCVNQRRKDDVLAKYREKANSKNKEKNSRAFFEEYKILDEFYRNGNFIEGLHSQIKFYLLISAKLKRPLHEISKEDMRKEIHLAEDILKKSQQSSERKAKETAEALLLEESKSKSTLAPAKNANQPQKTSQKNTKKTDSQDQIRKDSKEEVVNQLKDPITIAISQIHRSESGYKLAPRVLRWGTKNIADIRQFSDWDPTINQKIYGYLEYSEEQLWQEKNCHNLIGIEKFVSQSTLKEHYCFANSYLDPKSNSEKNGLGIYAVKVDQKGKKEAGAIYLGIDDENRIYHAAFVPINDYRFLPNQLVQKFDENNDDLEEKWSVVSEYSFSLLGDRIVQMQIGKKNAIFYHFYPLNDN